MCMNTIKLPNYVYICTFCISSLSVSMDSGSLLMSEIVDIPDDSSPSEDSCLMEVSVGVRARPRGGSEGGEGESTPASVLPHNTLREWWLPPEDVVSEGRDRTPAPPRARTTPLPTGGKKLSL